MICMEDREAGLRDRRQHRDELLHEPPDALARQHPEARRASRCGPTSCPSPRVEQLKKAVELGMVVVGDPDDCAKAVQRWVDIGADQICFSPTTSNMGQEDDHRVDGAVRQGGHPAVRHRPGAPQHPHAPGRVDARPRPPRWARPAFVTSSTRPARPDPATGSGRRHLQPGRPLGGRRRPRADAHRRRVRRRAAHLRRARGPGQPAGQLAGRRRASARAARRPLPHQRHRVPRGDAGLLQAPGRADQRQLPLRGRRAALPVRRCRRGGRARAARVPGAPGRGRPRAAGHPRGASAVGDEYEAAPGRRRRRSGTSPSAAATTTTSSTPAARPACPRAWCGARRTRSSPASAAAIPTRQAGPVDAPGRGPGPHHRRRPSCSCPWRPLMHAAGQWTSLSWLYAGGTVVLLPGSLDPVEVWRTVEREQRQPHDRGRRPRGAPAGRRVGRRRARSTSRRSSRSAAAARRSRPSLKDQLVAMVPNASVADGFGSSETGAQGTQRLEAGATSDGVTRFTPYPRHDGARRRHPPAGRAGLRRHRAGRAPGPGADRLLQRPGEDGGDVRRDRRRALGASPGTWPPSTRTAPSSCSAGAR